VNSPHFLKLIDDLREEVDHVIFDTPPIIGFAEGRTISSMTEGTVLVFRHHSTSKEAGRLATQLLTQVNAHVLGGILNMAQSRKLGYGGYYRYYKYYSKYYSQYISDDKSNS
jgi:Mrp family chromosome partitioning ATPase